MKHLVLFEQFSLDKRVKIGKDDRIFGLVFIDDSYYGELVDVICYTVALNGDIAHGIIDTANNNDILIEELDKTKKSVTFNKVTDEPRVLAIKELTLDDKFVLIDIEKTENSSSITIIFQEDDTIPISIPEDNEIVIPLLLDKIMVKKPGKIHKYKDLNEDPSRFFNMIIHNHAYEI